MENEIYHTKLVLLFSFYILVINVKLTTATVRWLGHPDMNTSFLTGSGYNVFLKCEKEYNKTMTYTTDQVSHSIT
jgi:hypothetical protein